MHPQDVALAGVVSTQAAVVDGDHVRNARHDPLGDKEAEGQLAVVARGAHHDDEGCTVDLDLEGLLASDEVRSCLKLSFRETIHPDGAGALLEVAGTGCVRP